MSFLKTDGPEPDPDWTPAEGALAVAFVVILALAGAACVWLQSMAG